MGYGSYSHEAHVAITQARQQLPQQQVFKQTKCHPLMNPHGVKFRESRDSVEQVRSGVLCTYGRSRSFARRMSSSETADSAQRAASAASAAAARGAAASMGNDTTARRPPPVLRFSASV